MPNEIKPGDTPGVAIDMAYVERVLRRLMATPSPVGYTDRIVAIACEELNALDGVELELTRRGAIRAGLKGSRSSPDRAIVAHLDTLGAMVKGLKDNGRLDVIPLGTWSARFAEGARVTIFTDDGPPRRGTILPMKASGHTYNEAVDTQPIAWENLEVRVDEVSNSAADLSGLGFNVGDPIALDPGLEITPSGFVNSRYLDDKAGVAAMLGAAKAVLDAGVTIPLDCHLLLTISEEVGVGASHILHGDVAEMVSIDNGTLAPGQNTSEFGVTISMCDASGPYDRHLTHKLIGLCRENRIEHSRDIFKYYHSDAASALEAGNDIRTALVCFGLDASHGYERVHLDSLHALSRLLAAYIQSRSTFEHDQDKLIPLDDYADELTPPS